MATNNNVDVSLSGQTGTGNFAGSNSPAFVTPTLGVATATSINFGVSSLADYINTTSFSPTFTCASPGDLSFVYTTQTGFYIRIGNVIFYNVTVAGTPTFATASGQIQIGGLPVAPNQSTGDSLGICENITSFVYPAGTTQLSSQTLGAGGNLGLISYGSATVSSTVTMANITTAVAIGLQFSGFYFV